MCKRFLLCFHDFSVWNYQKVTPILEELKELVGGPFSLLVIPDTENATDEAVENFRVALVKLKSEGFELALHGFKHKAEFSQGRSYAGLVGMNLTGGEAEFAGLSEYENADAPIAFVPPTWFSNKFLPGQVRAEKMLYEDRFSLTTAEGVRYASPVASFAGIPKSTEKAAFVYAEGILKIPFGVPRIAVHPVDFPRLNDKIRDLIRLALGCKRRLTLYRDL